MPPVPHAQSKISIGDDEYLCMKKIKLSYEVYISEVINSKYHGENVLFIVNVYANY